YIYKTGNYGKSWTLLTTGSNGIPADYPTRVIREDPVRKGLLYAGTEFGMFVSFDDGANWMPFQQNLPVTPITDIKIHRGDLVLSTMGRSFWVLDNITSLRQEQITRLNDEPVLFKPRDTYRYRHPMVRTGKGAFPVYPRPSVIIDYYLPEKVTGSIRLDILNDQGDIINTYLSDSSQQKVEEKVIVDMSTNNVTYLVDASLTVKPGLNRFHWNMKHLGPWDSREGVRFRNGPMVLAGNYTARLTSGEKVLEQAFSLLKDPRVTDPSFAENTKKQLGLALKTSELLSKARKLETELRQEHQTLDKKRKVDGLNTLEKERFASVEQVLSKIKTKEGIYEQPMLKDQIGYLYNMLNRADQAPGKDAEDRFTELSRAFKELKGKL
ncbi:MAG: hypothetical protein MJA30_10210, partial [Cytophagales bacterium]|nr:hypothetical protein [Cytophagales bacterium]